MTFIRKIAIPFASILLFLTLWEFLVGFNAISKATLVPVIVLIFIGYHDFNTILLVFMISFFPIAVPVSLGR